jgi:hypothetical protein
VDPIASLQAIIGVAVFFINYDVRVMRLGPQDEPEANQTQQLQRSRERQHATDCKTGQETRTWLRPAMRVRLRARLLLCANRNRRKARRGRTKKKQLPAIANARRKGSRALDALLLIVSFILVRKMAPMRERTRRVNSPAARLRVGTSQKNGCK